MPSSLSRITRSLRRLVRPSEAQDLIEYALLLALVAGTVLIALQGLGVKVSSGYATTSEALPGGDPGITNPGKGNPGNGNPGNGKPVGNPGGGNPGKGTP